MESKSLSAFLLWFITNALIIRGIFYFGFQHDLGIVAPILITIIFVQVIVIVFGKNKK